MPQEKSLFNSFAEMENDVCHLKCYFNMFMKSRIAQHCKYCKMQSFKKFLREYCDAMEDDGK